MCLQKRDIISNHLVVVGGAEVEVRDGSFYTKASVVEYLRELSVLSDKKVLWFSHRTKYTQGFSSHIDGSLIDVYTIDAKRTFFSAIDILAFVKILRKSHSVIHYYPRMVGVNTVLMRLFATRYIVYYPSSPIAIWKYELQKRANIKNLIKGSYYIFNGALASILADAILVRDQNQYRDLSRVFPNSTFLSQPVICNWGVKEAYDEKIQKKTFDFLFVGILHRRKGLGILLQAMAKVLKNSKSPERIKLTIVGGGGEHFDDKAFWSLEKWINYAMSLGLKSESVSFAGYITNPTQLKEIYARSDFLVHPTLHEGFPRVIDEAMRFGLPVLTTRIAQIKSVLRDGSNALLVPPNDVDALAKAMHRVIDDRTLREKLFQGSLDRARQIGSDTAASQHWKIAESICR